MSVRYTDRYSRSPREEKTPEGKPKGRHRKAPEDASVGFSCGGHGWLSNPSHLSDARGFGLGGSDAI